MNEAVILKIMTKNEEDFSTVIQALEEHFSVSTTSGIIFDEKTKQFHRFIVLTNTLENSSKSTVKDGDSE